MPKSPESQHKSQKGSQREYTRVKEFPFASVEEENRRTMHFSAHRVSRLFSNMRENLLPWSLPPASAPSLLLECSLSMG